METFGSFLKGAVAGIAALGLLSWFVAAHWGEKAEDAASEED